MSQKNCFLPESTASDAFSGLIDDKPLRFRGEVYHGYHFNCTACGVELNSEAREVRCRPGFAANEMVSSRMFHMVSYQLEECSELQATERYVFYFQNELYCLRCHDKMGIPICGACRRPIEERVVTALGKHWHVEVSFAIIYKKYMFINNHAKSFATGETRVTNFRPLI